MTLPPFQALVDSHHAEVHRFLVATVGPVEADDCLQETLLAALRAYPRLRHADNLRGWLLRIAHRKALDAHRARRRRPVPAEAVPERVAGPGGRAAASPDGDAAAPDGTLWAAVRRLPPKQRTAVLCRSVLGMPYAELAGMLDSSEEAVRRNVHEGLRRLREEWTG